MSDHELERPSAVSDTTVSLRAFQESLFSDRQLIRDAVATQVEVTGRPFDPEEVESACMYMEGIQVAHACSFDFAATSWVPGDEEALNITRQAGIVMRSIDADLRRGNIPTCRMLAILEDVVQQGVSEEDMDPLEVDLLRYELFCRALGFDHNNEPTIITFNH